MTTARRDNIQSIQLLRGIAALMVLLTHSIGLTGYLSETNFFHQIASYGWIGVEMFFIISGFIIPYSMLSNNYKTSDFGNLLVKRIVRIEPPYIFSIVLWLLLYYASYFLSPNKNTVVLNPVDWGNVLGHIGYINAFTHRPWLTPVYWTLAIEFEYYVIIGLVFRLIISADQRVRLGTHILLLATTFLTPYIYMPPGIVIFSHIFYYFPFFLMGIAMFLYRCNIILLKEFMFMIIIDSAVCLFYHDHGVLLFCLSIVSLLAIHFIKRVPQVFLWLGAISYSLYLTHTIVINRFLVLSGKITKDRYIGIRLIGCLLFCLLVAYLYYFFVERLFINLSKRIKYIHPAKSEK